MFALVITGIDTNELLDFDFYNIREAEYYTGLHFNEDNGLFNVAIARDEEFSFRMAEHKLYLTGGLVLDYYETPIYYIKADELKIALEEWRF